MNYLGVDIGSSSCKALAVDEDGRQLVVAQRQYDVAYSENGGATLDSDEVIKKCFEVITECARQLEPKSIKGIGVSSQGEAFTAIGCNGETLSDAMVSSDTSSGAVMEEWVRHFGEERLYQITGHTPHPMFTLFKLLWFRNAESDLWRKSRYFFCFEDLLQFRLGLAPAISWSLAGRTLMFDVRKHEWDENILQEIHLRAENLATPIPPGRPVGTVAKEIADRLGLSDDVVVVTGGHDQTCSALGAGVVDEGVGMLATGTVECICPALSKAVFSQKLKENNLCTYNYAIEDLFTTVAFSLTGGNIFKWFKDQFGHQENEEAIRSGKDAYTLLLENMSSTPSNLLVLPYFTPSGTPYFDTHTKGAILGLQLSTQRKDILKALLEGVSFEMRLNLEILENAGHAIKELRWVGGGSKSKLLAQLKANVMNTKVTLLNITEAGSFGAAMLACADGTGEPIRSLASRWVSRSGEVYPQTEYAEQYRERFAAYKRLYESVKSLSV
jgi:xylulokinase